MWSNNITENHLSQWSYEENLYNLVVIVVPAEAQSIATYGLICDFMQTWGTTIVMSCSLIVFAHTNCKFHTHLWIATMNIHFLPPHIHGIVCKNIHSNLLGCDLNCSSLSSIYHCSFLCNPPSGWEWLAVTQWLGAEGLICIMMTSSNGNIFRVTGPSWGDSTGHCWIPLTKAIDAELWCFLWSWPEQTVVQTIKTPVIWDAIVVIWHHRNVVEDLKLLYCEGLKISPT